jgi:hypothetical protein
MTPSFRVSQYCVVGVALVEEAVSFTTAVDEKPVDVTEHSNFAFSFGIGALAVGDASAIHRARECMNRSSSSLWNLTARPGPAGVSRPSRTALHKVTELTFVYRAASS